MRNLTLIGVLLSGCTWISERSYDDQIDQDGDGLPFDDDCAPSDPDRSQLVEGFEDVDGDGFGGAAITVCGALDGVTQLAVGGDCNDDDPDVSPVADERCNGIDDDCDGVFDADDPGLLDGIAFYEDADGDGTPAPGGAAVIRCEAPAGRAEAPAGGVWDCNDGDDTINPAATEVCDGIDNDCVGGIDDGLPELTSYVDLDLDGYGTTEQVVIDCQIPAGFVSNDDDCNDDDEAISPAASEQCATAVDEDCDGEVDEEGGAVLRYRDADLDGFSDGESAMLCELPGPGWLDTYDSALADCNDDDSSLFPGAPDVPYDGIDSDCAGDDDFDADGDGFQRQPEGPDCNDADATIYPGAADAPYDGIDSDCAGDNDDDADGDGFTAVAEGGADCDDTDDTIRPDGTEVYYNGIDQNCDGADDYDADGDGYAPDAWAGLTALPTGDCDDEEAATHPGAADPAYDGTDSDCAGDDDYDVDGDGHAPSFVTGSGLPEDDCNDADPTVHGGAQELCNGIDDDCDGTTDEPGSAGPAALQSLVDADVDGAPSASFETVCAFAPGFVDPALGLATDCDDGDAAVFPGAAEVPDDGIDQDCDGPDAVTCFEDQDLDGAGGSASVIDPTGTCAGTGLAAADTDCDDADPESYPGAVELCDLVDQDCDGVAATDRISGRLAADGTGELLWPGSWETATDVDVTPYSEISVCGPGPWALPALSGTAGLSVTGVTSPAPTLSFTGADHGIAITTADEVSLANLHLIRAGGAPADLALVYIAQADVSLTGLELDGISAEAAVVLDTVQQVSLADSDVHDGDHSNAPIVVYDAGPTTIRDTLFTRNTGGTAGAIDVWNTGVSGSGLTFDGNTSTDFAGAIRLAADSRLDLFSATFDGNTALGGGALYVGPNAELEVELSDFRNNQADYGGALLVHGAADVGSSSLDMNTATDGGAILVERCGSRVACTEGINPQPLVQLDATGLFDNSAEYGGALMVDQGAALLSGIVAERNTAMWGGGHIYARGLSQVSVADGVFSAGESNSGGALSIIDSVATLVQCDIDGNTASNSGGGIHGDDTATVTLENTSVRNNTAYRGGGAEVSGQLNARESELVSNTAQSGGGGAQAGRFVGTQVTISQNTVSSGSGGGLDAQSGYCESCTIESNSASSSGGGVYTGSYLLFTLAECDVVGNSARYGAGARGNLEILHTTFAFNTATDFAGAVMFDGPTAYVFDTHYLYNNAGQRGGAVYTNGEYFSSFSSFEGNDANRGGAVWVNGDDGLFADTESTFDFNTASQGDLVYISDGSDGQADFDAPAGLFGVGTAWTGTAHAIPDGTTSAYCSQGACTCAPNPCL